MTEQVNLAILEDIFDLEAGSLSKEQVLKELEEWDSLSALSVVVMMKDQFDKKITGSDVRKFVKVEDILNLMC